MPEYVFDLAFDDTPRPPRGPVELSGPDQARSEARALASAMLNEGPGVCDTVTVTVRDRDADPVASVLISIAIAHSEIAKLGWSAFCRKN